ncbi:MAG: hypothetical protein IJR47_02920 [Clostridia bacterium]|nr:hypothetical protein [Clostridia bacterium]
MESNLQRKEQIKEDFKLIKNIISETTLNFEGCRKIFFVLASLYTLQLAATVINSFGIMAYLKSAAIYEKPMYNAPLIEEIIGFGFPVVILITAYLMKKKLVKETSVSANNLISIWSMGIFIILLCEILLFGRHICFSTLYNSENYYTGYYLNPVSVRLFVGGAVFGMLYFATFVITQNKALFKRLCVINIIAYGLAAILFPVNQGESTMLFIGILQGVLPIALIIANLITMGFVLKRDSING